jgi:hypothetical protein
MLCAGDTTIRQGRPDGVLDPNNPSVPSESSTDSTDSNPPEFSPPPPEMSAEFVNVLQNTFSLASDSFRVPSIFSYIKAVYDRTELLLKFQTMPGRHTNLSPALGLRAKISEQYAEFASFHPALLKFGNALYNDDPSYPGKGKDLTNGRATLKMIPYEFKADADPIAMQMYEEYCAIQGLDPQQAVEWADWDFRPGVTYIYDLENESNAWNAHVVVDTDGVTPHDCDVSYLPAGILALHELGHVEQHKEGDQKVGDTTPLYNSIHEIAQVIGDVIASDSIYKEIKGIGIDEVVEYPVKLPTQKGDGLNLGLVANTFRALKIKHGTIETALMSPGGLGFVQKYFSDEQTPSAPKTGEQSQNIESYTVDRHLYTK